MDIPDVARIERLSLRPGDRLVLSVDHRLVDDEWDALRGYVRQWGLPEGSVIILEAGLSLQVLEADPVAERRRQARIAGVNPHSDEYRRIV